jgi:hypothetical protein
VGLGLSKGTETPTKVYLPIASQGCAKMETQLLNKGKTMEYKSAGDKAVDWAQDRYSRAEEITEHLRNHWAEIWPENSMTEEELTWRLLPMAIDILKQHPDFADRDCDWQY